MLLSNLYSVTEDRLISIEIADGKILAITNQEYVSTDKTKSNCLSFENAIVFPGLINSHDHLDFNLFPKLGNKKYNNYEEWGLDIHKQNKDTIDAVLKVPKALRIQWGIYKNLLNGITTVVNHGSKLEIENELINVYQNCQSLHSVQLEKHWKLKLNFPHIKKQTFAIHVGEGTDKMAHAEIDELIQWNLFRKDLVGIHAIAMNEKQANKFKALVWCPDSNYFLIGKTADINKLKKHSKIIFGTDSTLSADWNLWNHLRLARKENAVTDAELYNMLTTTPAEVWSLPLIGKIETNYHADIVVAKRKNNTKTYDDFYKVNPEDLLLVMHRGNIVLFNSELLKQISNVGVSLTDFSKIEINGESKYVRGNLGELMKQIKSYYPEVSFSVVVVND